MIFPDNKNVLKKFFPLHLAERCLKKNKIFILKFLT